MRPTTGDFAEIMDQANRMADAAVVHPFGNGPSPLARVGQGRGLPVRQITQMFYCPKDLAEYDACCNRAWAGEISIRFEERTFTKEGEWLVVVCFMEQDEQRPLPGETSTNGDTEPDTRPHKLT